MTEEHIYADQLTLYAAANLYSLWWLDRVSQWRYRPSLNSKYASLRNNYGTSTMVHLVDIAQSFT